MGISSHWGRPRPIGGLSPWEAKPFADLPGGAFCDPDHTCLSVLWSRGAPFCDTAHRGDARGNGPVRMRAIYMIVM